MEPCYWLGGIKNIRGKRLGNCLRAAPDTDYSVYEIFLSRTGRAIFRLGKFYLRFVFTGPMNFSCTIIRESLEI